jgi:hypothetical protein
MLLGGDNRDWLVQYRHFRGSGCRHRLRAAPEQLRPRKRCLADNNQFFARGGNGPSSVRIRKSKISNNYDIRT